ncbi:hypothetical protein Har1130_15995 [Haloarcula sp. CBA1130]|uniref:hypothetical protein n=1 Tax=unclassified Haloarcula TaxID=2624677 RepID=UPI00124558CA|nr:MULTISPECIES: hypothetical protein [unclassified Haloarcula]KAA9395804.1 hypothetical protein Har1129_17920 [Haloarcula sp. CBA1129]KAA9400264.1 hypothetical protein Har1130_15995 [Haloarcula sp. CBA1130]
MEFIPGAELDGFDIAIPLSVIRWFRGIPTLSDRWLAFAVGGSLLLQLAALYSPLGDDSVVSLGLSDLGLWLGLGLLWTSPSPAV